MVMGTRAAAVVLAASLLGLAIVSPVQAQRANCAQLARLVVSERALERRWRDIQRVAIHNFAAGRGAYQQIPLSPAASRQLQYINAAVRRHAGNVQRLQAQYARMGCGGTQQARRPSPACSNGAAYNYRRCMAGGAGAARCAYEYRLNMSRC